MMTDEDMRRIFFDNASEESLNEEGKRERDNYCYVKRTPTDALARYQRPFTMTPANDQPIEAMLVDLTMTMENTTAYWGPVLRLYGITAAHNSCVVEVRHFFPYLYVDMNKHEMSDFDLINRIEEKLEWASNNKYDPKDRSVVCIPKYALAPKGLDNCISIEHCERMQFMGYRPDPVKLLKITMRSPKHIRVVERLFEYKRIVDGVRCATFEANIPYELRFMADRGLGGCQWFRAMRHKPVKHRHDYAVDVVVSCKLDNLVPIDVAQMSTVAPFRWMAFDIEACKQDGRGFVSPEEDPVSQIGIRIRAHPNTVVDDVVFCLLPRDDASVDDIGNERRLEMFRDERDLLMRLRDYIVEADVDVFTGWNICGFDWYYLFARAEHLGLEEWPCFSRTLKKKATIRSATFTSAAFGTREDYATSVEGRFDFDMFKAILRSMKLRSYALNNVLKVLFNREKVNMPYEKIPEYQNGTDAQRAHLAHYCWVDAAETLEIADNRKLIDNAVEQARICGVPLKWLPTRGQQIKTLGKLLPLANSLVFALPSSTRSQNDEFTQGATVKEPLRGFYRGPVVVLDFASLYPSIMIADNISYDTKVSLEWAQKHLKEGDYRAPAIPDADYVYVAKHIRNGLLPRLEEELLRCRRAAKAEMKAEQDPIKHGVLDARQQQLKVVCNSVYGFTKANMFCDKDLMESITAAGREMLDITSRYVEGYYSPEAAAKRVLEATTDEERTKAEWEATIPQAKVIYGDSVTGDTPILIRYNLYNQYVVLDYVSVEDIPVQSAWTPYHDDKEAAEPVDGLQVWSDTGFTTVRRIIRHRTEKPIVRVTTCIGTVKVTEDHSLLRPDGQTTTPKEVDVGSELMHAALPESGYCAQAFSKDAMLRCPYAAGLFYGKGDVLNGAWCIEGCKYEFLKRAQQELCDAYPGLDFEIVNWSTLCCTERVNRFESAWQWHFYSVRHQKKVPASIINAPLAVVERFMDGYYDARTLRNDSEIGSAGIFLLCTRLGYRTSLSGGLRVACTTESVPHAFSNEITRKEQLEDNDADIYVYDLETESHHFAAGVGRLVVHNTDSIMVYFSDDLSFDDAITVGYDIERRASALFRAPNKLEFEKIGEPFLLIGKKRYAMMKYEGEKAMHTRTGELDTKGMEDVRRDNAPIGSETQHTVLNMIMRDMDVDGAIRYLKDVVHRLYTNQVDMSMLVISKGLSKTMKKYAESGTKQAHVELAKRIEMRAPNTGEDPYATGDRVKYVMVKGRNKKEKAFERSEDPLYALKNRIPIDVDYYIEKQLVKWVCRLLTPIVAPEENAKSKLAFKDGKMVLEQYDAGKESTKRTVVNKNGKEVQKDLTPPGYKSLKVYKMIFEGEHTKHRVQTVNRSLNGSITGFLVPQHRCVECRALMTKLDQGHSKLCRTCVKSVDEILVKQRVQHQALEKEQREAWLRCQACVGMQAETLAEERVPCTNLDCDNFFRRTRLDMDIEDLCKKLI